MTATATRARVNGHKVALAKPKPAKQSAETQKQIAVIEVPSVPATEPEKRKPTKARINQALRDQRTIKGLELWAAEQASNGDLVGANNTRRDIERKRETIAKDLDHWHYTTRTPQRGNGNELVPLPEPEHPARRDYKRHMVEQPAGVLEHQASSEAMDLLADNETLALALDLANELKAKTRVQKMLAHQAATLHSLGMSLAAKAKHEAARMVCNGVTGHNVGLHQAASLEAQRQTNAASRAFSAFNEAVLTLQKLRTGGKQIVQVQHVTIRDGGKAVVGQNVKAGRKSGGNSGRGAK